MGLFHKKPGELLLKNSKALSRFDRKENTEMNWYKHRDLYIPRKKDTLTPDTLFSPEYTTGVSKSKKRLRKPTNRIVGIIIAIVLIYLICMFLWVMLT